MTEAVVDQRTVVSVRARLTFAAARLVVRPLLTYWPLTNWGLFPLTLLDTAAELLPAPRGVRYEKVDLDGFTGEWMRPNDATDGVLLYFHGGAFVTCGIATHRHAVARMAEACGMPALSVAYRQLPAVPLAGSVADCLAAYRYLLAQGYRPDRIVLAGDSAGGCLAFATALAAMAGGLPRPAGIVALSPWLDFDPAAKLAHPNAGRDAYAPVGRLPALATLLGATEPAASPVNGELAGLPPVLLITAESEMLRCDAELMAERLAAADVQVTLQIWSGQIHAFPVLGDLLPESTAAIAEIGTFIRDLLPDVDATALAC
ncbi:MAG TPA: alpha/beta hydrolase [Pseudonocardiaceae bacterium]|jgi:acetyl esterase/lipase|nr:alpha/beta hydrolase [Pseudonocardiaceae bacterium]